MKKSNFYLRYKTGFHLVNGYIDTITDDHGNKFIIGFHRTDIGSRTIWGASHIESGLAICSGGTRKECLEKVKSERTLNMLNEATQSSEQKEVIEEMNQFLKTGAIDND